MPQETHALLDGKLHVYRRENSSYWHCSTFLSGRNHRVSTKEKNLVLAMEFAHEWYLERYVEDRRRRRGGELLNGTVQQPVGTDAPTDGRRRKAASGRKFRDVAKVFLDEYQVITQGERNALYVRQKSQIVDLHLNPFLGDRDISSINAGTIQEYRVHRQTSRVDKAGEPKRPARSTIHHELVTLRQVMKTANRKGWIAALPDMTVAYKTSGKVAHRAWFSPSEYKALYEATRHRASNPTRERWRPFYEDLHDLVLFMGNTGLRPDEVARLQVRDITVVNDEATGGRILEIEVRGKRGTGYCKSMPGAVHPFQRAVKRKALGSTDKLFSKLHSGLFNRVLEELEMKFDREGNVRTTYSLRHTYICMRLLEGADIYQIAKNCRTSVEMIEKHYAAHLKNTLDTAAINVRKPKSSGGRTRKTKATPTLPTAPRSRPKRQNYAQP